MKRILSLDPGHTTGIAVYDEEGLLEMSMAVSARTVTRPNWFFDLLNFVSPEIILIESLPQNYVDELTNQVWHHLVDRIKFENKNLVQIKPSQWKGLTARVEIPGQHARDAATMAKWWIENNERN